MGDDAEATEPGRGKPLVLESTRSKKAIDAKSEFFAAPLPAWSIAALALHMRAGRRVAGHSRGARLHASGRCIQPRPLGSHSLPHRSARFLLKHEVVIDAGDVQAAAPAPREWLARSCELAHPSGTGGGYVNFPDADSLERPVDRHDRVTRRPLAQPSADRIGSAFRRRKE